MFSVSPSVLLVTLAIHQALCMFVPNLPGLDRLLSRYRDELESNGTVHGRTRRAIQWADREDILNLHNKLRGQVEPFASNMEYMVWDDELERSATQWAEQCVWDHGPEHVLRSCGQNLAVHWGRYRSPAYHVQAWYDEVKDYTYPYPWECNPSCPERCSGPMCTHYTQLVWATTNRVGCAVNVCPRMNVWGEQWENAIYLVCNYSPKGNWIGEAPYSYGPACSQCPPSYGGVCRDNLCYKGDSRVQQRPETEDMNEVEKAQVPVHGPTTTKPTFNPRAKPGPAAPKKPSAPKPAGNAFLAQNVKCETKMREKCRGAMCSRYKCPANCLNKRGKVWGSHYYDVQSSICRAALHAGVIDNNGGLVDTSRTDSLSFFVKSNSNGIQSLGKLKSGNAFAVAKVNTLSVDCFSTVAEICPFQNPPQHCPRVWCPARCKEQPSYWTPVIGNGVYLDSSSICVAATHAGVINADGGYVDILALEKKQSYAGTFKNGVQSKSMRNPEGSSFRVFAVRE